MTTTMIDFTRIGKEMKDEMCEFLECNTDDYKRFRDGYKMSVDMIRKELIDRVPYADELPALIDTQIQSELVYAFYLGMTANIEHFRNPKENNFLNKDFDDILKEGSLYLLPDYMAAQEKLGEFYRSIPSEYRRLKDEIIEYSCYLETYGPKIAHYCGYIFGNRFFLCTEPGYVPDMAYTYQYHGMVEEYLNIRLPIGIHA